MSAFVLLLFVTLTLSQFPGYTDVLNLVQSKENSVQSICNAVRTYYSTGEASSNCDVITKCQTPSELNSKATMLCQTGFGEDQHCSCSGSAYLSRDELGVRYSDTTDPNDLEVKKFLCFSESLKSVFRDNYQSDSAINWQYIGSPLGAYSIWPLTSDMYVTPHDEETCKNQYVTTCSPYDPRIRPWYIAAASGPKDIVMILDISGSMNEKDSEGNVRLHLLKAAANDVVNGLGIYDRMSVVFFNNDALTCADGSYVNNGDSLLRVTSDVKKAFKHCIDQISGFSETNFGAGFQKAFQMFNTRQYDPSMCHSVIIFLTDGISNRGMSNSELLQYIREENTNDLKAKIFTFSMGHGADTYLTQRIACEHNGVHEKIESSSDLRSKMSSYYDYFTYSNASRGVTWTERYFDFSGLGWMVTVAQGCFSNSNELFGVAGVDVLISEFNDVSNYTLYVKDFLFDRSHRCYDISMSNDQLEAMRKYKCNYPLLEVIVTLSIISGIAIVVSIIVIFGMILSCFIIPYATKSMKEHARGNLKEIKINDE